VKNTRGRVLDCRGVRDPKKTEKVRELIGSKDKNKKKKQSTERAGVMELGESHN